jgi:predicted ATPase
MESMSDEIHEIKKQFDNDEWKLFLKSFTISNIHGWINQEVDFKFPIVAFVGENGIGKSTFLKAALCAFKNTSGFDFYPSKMFMNTQWDRSATAGAVIEYTVIQGDPNHPVSLKWKKTNDWGFSPRRKKPKRNVFFLDISRTLPLDATAGYAKIAKLSNIEVGKSTELSTDSIKEISYILGVKYEKGRFTNTNIGNGKEVGLLTKSCGEISQFHQGAGEDEILDIFKLLQNIPMQSLLVIDEVENSLHPLAQRRFIKYLITLCRQKKLQIIISTHSPFVLEELPDIARIMLLQTAEKKEIMYGISSQFALSTIDDVEHPEIYVFLEDEEAGVLFWELLKRDDTFYNSVYKRISMRIVGSCTILKTLGQLCREQKLPYKGIAIVDGDKAQECKSTCLSLPGDLPPEKLIFNDLKEKRWEGLDARFGMGAGDLFKILDDSIILPDHHVWPKEVGDTIHMSKDAVWSILVNQWCKICLSIDEITNFIGNLKTEMRKQEIKI